MLAKNFEAGKREIGHKNPSREFFKAILTRMGGIKKEEIIFWDDDKENVKGAKKFGFRAKLYISFEEFKMNNQ